CGDGLVELQRGPRLAYLLKRTRQPAHRPSAPLDAGASHFSGLLWRLHEDHVAIAKRRRIDSLVRLTSIGEPGPPCVRTQEHRAIAVGDEKPLENGFV